MSENGRILLPAEVRRAANIKPREVLTIRVDEEGIHLQTRRQALARLRALVKSRVGEGRSLANELVAERRQDAGRE